MKNSGEFLGERIAEINMFRASCPNMGFLVVEGEKDLKYCRSKVHEKYRCKVIVCYGKKHVIKLLEMVTKHEIKGVLAFVDRDWDVLAKRLEQLAGWELPPHIWDAKGPRKNFVYTDQTDFESTIVASDYFRKFVAEHFDDEAFVESLFGTTDFKTVAATLRRIAGQIGVLKYLSQQERWQLDFKNLKFADFLALDDNLELNNEDMLKSVIIGSQNAQTTFAESHSPYLDKANDVDYYCSFQEFCTGHVVSQLISFVLTEGKCAKYPKHVNPETVESGLRLCFEWEQTELYSSICSWQYANVPYAFVDNSNSS